MGVIQYTSYVINHTYTTTVYAHISYTVKYVPSVISSMEKWFRRRLVGGSGGVPSSKHAEVKVVR